MATDDCLATVSLSSVELKIAFSEFLSPNPVNYKLDSCFDTIKLSITGVQHYTQPAVFYIGMLFVSYFFFKACFPQ